MKEQKNRLRKQIEALREALSQEARERRSREICLAFRRERLLDELKADSPDERGDGAVLCAYIPFRSEVDVRPLIEWCWRERIRVAVPRVDSRRRDFQLYLIRGYGDLEPGAWGIEEPKVAVCARLDDISSIRAVLIPGVAFDRYGGRMGYGGGFYDRFLSRFAGSGAAMPALWAAAFGFQIVDKVPMEAHDIPVDRIVTERGLLAMQKPV